ncbi:vacuolar import and degradation protein-like protein [Cucurbitaria berberidis CBS 394.84]|uniref:Vacuolar import and degradation protein-like protein n=1 Tax=Cucurbitaria berberidis CBS 394.84 TaxID=1168544 RepID=A0A9P4GNY2_9PLEO|nr:vacuolar import and degradation protein-like protein [Cucurbitaria berberidis CBS 394.84]KAF1848455.1 vacuolar import and degradation protein-like protein [Cucurbitaria berberidis CBS 394.84]
MFMLRNLSKFVFGDSSKETIVEISQGQLYLVRPRSVKGYSELIFKDAAATIRRTGQEFQYQLVIQRAYEEGEEDLLAEEGGEDAVLDTLAGEKDEKTFLLDEDLQFRDDVRSTGEKIFAWRDLSGDVDDLWEFVCDASVKPETAALFERVALQCQYERKYRRSHEHATEDDLEALAYYEEPIPDASPVASPTRNSLMLPAAPPTAEELFPNTTKENMVKKVAGKGKSPQAQEDPTAAPPSAAQPEVLETLAEGVAELHLFDFPSGTFIKQDSKVLATVTEIGNWNYWLHIAGEEREWLGQPVVEDINPVFNYEFKSFIFNHYLDDGSAYSWLLRFNDQEELENLQNGVMQALWEHLNKVKWQKAKDTDREYVLEAFQDLTMEDAPEDEQEEEEEDEYESTNDQRSEHYDSDESEEDVETGPKDGAENSQLAVGYKHDRSFVVRGNKIGVFKHTDDNQLQFSTTISNVRTPKGKAFNPNKVMLHQQDQDMILQNLDNPNALYRMDLETGQVVDEWKVHDDIPVKVFAPENKFAQMSGEQTFLGLSGNALYRVDPRLAGNKLVDDQLKQYATKNAFSAAATTEKGHIAVASEKGDIRLFDRLGINAKTLIPALGDPIIGMDVSADGRWVLATTRTYLLLIDALQKGGKNDGKLGFEKSFAKDDKPQPRRLALTPAHVAQFQHETKAPISFTTGRFNTGLDDKETTIITATGPFIVTWSLKKILANRRDPYSIKRYAEEVKADNFKFGSDKNLIVALPNEVDMVARRALQKPTRESIATPSRVGANRRSGVRGSYLGRNDIVNSPY